MKRASSGFTIIELLIVVAIIGIIASIVVVSYQSVRQQANETTVKTHLADAKSKLDRIRSDTGVYPASLDGTGVTEPDQITYTYYYGSTTNLFCLQGVSDGFSSEIWYVSSLNNDPVKASCPAPEYDSSLVGWWPLNGTAVSLVDGRSGTVSGATVAAGQNQNSTAYSFDGVNDYIEVDPQPASPTEFTVSAWVKGGPGPSAADGVGYIFHRGISQTQGSSFFWVGASTAYGGNVSGTGGPGTGFGVETNVWHLMTMTYDGSTVRFYIDGVFRASAAKTFTNQTTGTYMTIGGAAYAPAYRPFLGTIDDVRVYSKMLTAPEVQSLYDADAR
jgi:prepilin-type N-terminal cleavage/methylation domain-containing protein